MCLWYVFLGCGVCACVCGACVCVVFVWWVGVWFVCMGVWCLCGVCVSVVWLVCLYEFGLVCVGVGVCVSWMCVL